MHTTTAGSVVLTAILSLSNAAQAANVFVQWVTPGSPGEVIRDPVFATITDGGAFAEADLATGLFKGRAFHDGAAQSLIATVAYSGIEDLTFTNTGPAPVVIGGAFPFDVTLSAAFAHTVDPLGIGSWETQLIAIFLVDVAGDPLRQAEIDFTGGENWNNGLQSSAFDLTPTSLGGTSATITTGTLSALDVTLSMGKITLDPGETMTVSLTLLPIAVADGAGFTATTDMASTAHVRLTLPAGVSLSSNASTPLDWVQNDDDIDGVPDALDNCPFFPNANQSDVGGVGAAAPPDGVGDACQCGDVNGNGRVTTADATLIIRSLLVPPAAVLLRPDLCDVGGSTGCTTADVVILTRRLLVPPTAVTTQACAAALP